MKLFHQRKAMDCVIAALAMFHNKNYDEVYSSYFKFVKEPVGFRGVYDNELIKISKDLGIRVKRRYGKPKGKCVLVMRFKDSDFGIERPNGDSICWHALYFDGLNIFDPAIDALSSTNYLTTNQYVEKSMYWFSKKKWWEL